MERTNYQSSNCSIGRALQVVGEKWTLLILRESFYGATRFEQFHSVLNCPRNLLSERLTKLVDEGILERSQYREWGDRHKADPEGPPVLARHAGCGKEVRVTLQCADGHNVARVDEMELVDGPGALPPVPA